VILPLGFVQSFDLEDGDPTTVQASDIHRFELPSPDQHKRAQEEVIGLDHRLSPFQVAPKPTPGPQPLKNSNRRQPPELFVPPLHRDEDRQLCG